MSDLATKSTDSHEGWHWSQIATIYTRDFGFREFNGGVPALIRLWVFRFDRNQWLSFNCHAM